MLYFCIFSKTEKANVSDKQGKKKGLKDLNIQSALSPYK